VRCCPMGDSIRKKPVEPQPAKQARMARARMRRRQARLGRVGLLLDFVLARLLVLAVTLAVLRGEVTTEVVGAIWASYLLLLATRSK
jgi:hypothetical protein